LQNCKTNTHNQAHSLKILFSNTQKTSNATENTSLRAREEHRVYSSIHKDRRTTTKKEKADRAQVTYLPATKRTKRNTDDRIVLAIAAAHPKNTTKKSAGKKKKQNNHKFFQCAKLVLQICNH
jgi:hypothetical protein